MQHTSWPWWLCELWTAKRIKRETEINKVSKSWFRYSSINFEDLIWNTCFTGCRKSRKTWRSFCGGFDSTWFDLRMPQIWKPQTFPACKLHCFCAGRHGVSCETTLKASDRILEPETKQLKVSNSKTHLSPNRYLGAFLMPFHAITRQAARVVSLESSFVGVSSADSWTKHPWQGCTGCGMSQA